MTRTRTLLLILAVGLGACGIGSDAPVDDDDAVGGPRPTEPRITVASGHADGPGISVEDALERGGTEAVLVNGALFVDPDGTVRLCSAIAESFPPQCGGTSLRVIGLDPSAVPDLEEANGVRWVERMQVYGVVSAG
jgi:hypothetical protein